MKIFFVCGCAVSGIASGSCPVVDFGFSGKFLNLSITLPESLPFLFRLMASSGAKLIKS
jgi:hypothetical protein